MGAGEQVPVPEGGWRGEITGCAFRHDGRVFAVFDVDGSPVVVDDACPHKAGTLSAGLLVDGLVRCPSHFYQFDLRTGECRTTAQYALTRYPVSERDGGWWVEIPPAQTLSWSERLRAHARRQSPG